MSTTVFSSVENGGRFSRYGDFVLVVMPACAFVATAMDFQQARQWAGSKNTSGAAHRDRTSFIERFEHMIARMGSGIATKGNSAVLAGLVKSMKANGLQIADFDIPQRIFDDTKELKYRPGSSAAAPEEPPKV
ncbi:MAG: hypothetical protein AABY95_08670 [Pseudomonadota bacterium]